ncbi:CDI toxin immunity protein [Priestia megaterium]|uniref:CDI toxin immunity protein n=1 Tax=Priestia megaterium TaxID=1404 RepID=UPI003F68A4F7
MEWDKFNKYFVITYLEDVKSLINDDDLEIYWSTDNFPVLKTKFENILSVYDDVIAVGSDTFL